MVPVKQTFEVLITLGDDMKVGVIKIVIAANGDGATFEIDACCPKHKAMIMETSTYNLMMALEGGIEQYLVAEGNELAAMEPMGTA